VQEALEADDLHLDQHLRAIDWRSGFRGLSRRAAVALGHCSEQRHDRDRGADGRREPRQRRRSAAHALQQRLALDDFGTGAKLSVFKFDQVRAM
jgi:hypothetical protein